VAQPSVNRDLNFLVAPAELQVVKNDVHILPPGEHIYPVHGGEGDEIALTFFVRLEELRHIGKLASGLKIGEAGGTP
jgi:hypothetical protein